MKTSVLHRSNEHGKDRCQLPVRFKGTGSRNRKHICYLYNLNCCPHEAIGFCTDFGGWGESTSYFQKSTNISAILQPMSVSFVSLRNSRVHLQINTFILRNVVLNLCDDACRKFCKIVISKEVCLHHATQPL